MVRTLQALTREDVARLVPGPGSTIWQRADDPRVMGAAGYALLLQVAHPTVAPAVFQLSEFREHPWRRLFRSIDYLMLMSFGGPEAAYQTARRLREIHQRIRGRRADGSRYNAFEPEAWTWVHATLGESAIAGIQHFGRALSRREAEQYFAEWRALGAVLGVEHEWVAMSWAQYRAYFEQMVEERLEDSDTVQEVLDITRRGVISPFRMIPDRAWKLAWRPVGEALWLLMAGLLPGTLKQRFGIAWTRARERQFQALCRGSRGLDPVMPLVRLVYTPQRYLWLRSADTTAYYLSPQGSAPLRGLNPAVVARPPAPEAA